MDRSYNWLLGRFKRPRSTQSSHHASASTSDTSSQPNLAPTGLSSLSPAGTIPARTSTTGTLAASISGSKLFVPQVRHLRLIYQGLIRSILRYRQL